MVPTILLSLLLSTAPDTPAAFKGAWQGPLVREARTNVLTLIIDDASGGEVHGRMLNNGAEFAPLSDGKIRGDRLTFRADTLQIEAVLANDALDATLTISHGRTFQLTFHRIAEDQIPRTPVAAPAPAASPLPALKPSEIARAPRPARAPGTLILAGGGVNAPAIRRRFTEITKGGPIVVIPTALDDSDLGADRLKSLAKTTSELFQSDDVVVLHTRDRAVADSEEFVKPVRRARGIWMLGGDTGNLVHAYQGTRMETEMKNVLERGGVIGGTSAGAIVQVSAIPSQDGHSVVRGFGFLPGVIVWPHWSERHAENDLVKYAERLQLVGVGIDEATAIVVHGDEFEVVGDGHVGIVDGNTHDGKDYYLLSAGQRFKMKPRGGVTDDGKAKALAKAMAAYGEDRFRGNVLAARAGTVLFRYENTAVKKFRIGSLTKQFTAAAILLLEERGALSTSDSIRRFLPDSPPEWSAVTIYDLLTHTSGIPEAGTRLDFQPGSEWTYSNHGYQLLGKIVERASGKSYGEFVRENIFVPLEMKDSSADPELTDLGGAGSLVASTDDLLKWEQGLFGGKILRPSSMQKMLTPYRNGYACALHVVSTNGRTIYANDGRVPGWNAALQYYAEDKVVIIVLANLDTQADLLIARDLARAALD